MASVATPTITYEWFDGKVIHAIGTIAVSSAAYVNNGIPCSFAGLIKGSQQAPLAVFIQGVAGFVYAFTDAAATQAGGLFLIFVNNSGGTNAALPQHTTATVVAGVVSDTITFHAIFNPMGR
jgi:hypothetical protein